MKPAHLLYLSDFRRLIMLAIIVALFFWLAARLPVWTGIAELAPLFTSSAMVLGLAAATHLGRRVLWPGLDSHTLARRAAESPIGAGLVFLGIALVIATVFHSNVTMLR